MNYHVLVDKKHGLDASYVPPNLINIDSQYKSSIKLDAVAYKNWLNLKREALKKCCVIDIMSAYRPYDYQNKLFNDLVLEKGYDYAINAVALPGHSEHQTGLAIDYTVFKNNEFIIEGDITSLEECQMINSTAHKYGFIVRYPKGKEDITGYKYEPWHLRYVGVDLATYLYEKDMTLDEYYNNKTTD
jgi:D-alanyl-D-alanine carboxypeptidase